MGNSNPSTNYLEVEGKPHRQRSREELFRTIEFEGATMYDKALAKAELDRRERSASRWSAWVDRGVGFVTGLATALLANGLIRWFGWTS